MLKRLIEHSSIAKRVGHGGMHSLETEAVGWLEASVGNIVRTCLKKERNPERRVLSQTRRSLQFTLLEEKKTIIESCSSGSPLSSQVWSK